MTDPAAAKPEKALNQNYEKRLKIVVIINPGLVWGNMFGEMKQGETDYTVV